MLLKNTGVQLMILGCLIVVVGAVLRLLEITGAMGLLILGGIVEVAGLFLYVLRKKK